MVLAAGTCFWLARAILALVRRLPSGGPSRRWRRAAMIGAIAYCVFSGSDVATERSLVMTLVMFGAILVDRPALSIRNLAIAALVVLAREPEALLGPGFQMSFGAVAALVAAAPLLKVPAGRRGPPSGSSTARCAGSPTPSSAFSGRRSSRASRHRPFTAYHFQSFNPLGLIGNALALPLVSAVVMPSVVLRRPRLSVRSRPSRLADDGLGRRPGARCLGLGQRSHRVDGPRPGDERHRDPADELGASWSSLSWRRPCDGSPSFRP